MSDLAERIGGLFAQGADTDRRSARDAFFELRGLLNDGKVRAAEPDVAAASGWRVNTWVKQGILFGFRFGTTVDMSADHGKWPFYDKDTMILKKPGVSAGVRIVPGGSTIREGAYVATSVVCMPPMYVNIGAFVDEGSLVDSHALVGSCAQVGRRVHLSAGAMLGGVLEPVGALPVIVEDEALIGGNCGVYEGTIVGRRAVLAAGVVLTGSVTVYDLPRQTTYRRQGAAPLRIPENAVVVPGARASGDAFAREHGLSLYTPVIVKYRDEKTDAATALEEALR